MNIVHSFALVTVLVLMLASVRWTVVARRGRHLTDLGRASCHYLAITFALWAIVTILLDLAIR